MTKEKVSLEKLDEKIDFLIGEVGKLRVRMDEHVEFMVEELHKKLDKTEFEALRRRIQPTR
jgi:hypothetical protein